MAKKIGDAERDKRLEELAKSDSLAVA